MPEVRYAHIDPTTRCCLGRSFSLYRQSTTLELKTCDVCNQAIREEINKPQMTLPLPNNPSMPGPSGPASLES